MEASEPVEVATVVAQVVERAVARVAADGAVAAMVAPVATVAQMAAVARAAEAWAVVKVVTAAVFWVEARQPRTSAAAAIGARPMDPNGPMTASGRLASARLPPCARDEARNDKPWKKDSQPVFIRSLCEHCGRAEVLSALW